MLSSSEILERVCSGKISFIGKPVNIQYDNRINLPIDFYFDSEHYEILEIINVKIKAFFFKKYLLRTDKGVFEISCININIPFLNLDLNFFWKLNFKVLE